MERTGRRDISSRSVGKWAVCCPYPQARAGARARISTADDCRHRRSLFCLRHGAPDQEVSPWLAARTITRLKSHWHKYLSEFKDELKEFAATRIAILRAEMQEKFAAASAALPAIAVGAVLALLAVRSSFVSPGCSDRDGPGRRCGSLGRRLRHRRREYTC